MSTAVYGIFRQKGFTVLYKGFAAGCGHKESGIRFFALIGKKSLKIAAGLGEEG